MMIGWFAAQDLQRVDWERAVRVVLRGGRPHQRRTEEGPARQNAGQQIFGYIPRRLASQFEFRNG